MKLVVDENHKNSKDGKWQDGDKLKRVKDIRLGIKSPKEYDSNSQVIEFGEPWAEHDFGSTVLSKADQEIYEWFCCGYLYYYDDVTRNGATDHAIHFVWKSPKVFIFLYPSAEVRGANDLPAGGGVDPQPPPAPPPPPKSV